MKIINRLGRVLLEVTEAVTYGNSAKYPLLYSYTGYGMGGHTTPENLERVIQCVKDDNPSWKVIGELPKPVQG